MQLKHGMEGVFSYPPVLIRGLHACLAADNAWMTTYSMICQRYNETNLGIKIANAAGVFSSSWETTSCLEPVMPEHRTTPKGYEVLKP